MHNISMKPRMSTIIQINLVITNNFAFSKMSCKKVGKLDFEIVLNG